MTAIAVAAIRLYRRTLSPFLPPACRYWPSCSAYAEEALREHGFVHGLSLALARLARCHPWGAHGVDPVPPANPGERTPHAHRASAPGRSA